MFRHGVSPNRAIHSTAFHTMSDISNHFNSIQEFPLNLIEEPQPLNSDERHEEDDLLTERAEQEMEDRQMAVYLKHLQVKHESLFQR